MSYSYRAYGFGINSPVSIPGLQPTQPDSHDIPLKLEIGPPPDWVKRLQDSPGRVLSHLPAGERTPEPSFVLMEYADANCFELAYSPGLRFVVTGTAERVWGAFEAPLTIRDLAMYLLGPVSGFLLRRLHITCLHSSAVDWNGNAVLFCADAGYGKSTTAAALALRGLPVVAEDIVPLELTRGKFRAVPGYPRVCLWPESVALLGESLEAFPRLTDLWDKRYLSLNGQRTYFARERLPVGVIYMLAMRSESPDSPRVEELTPKDALLELVKNTYMNWLLDREQRAEEFNVIGNLVQQVPVRRLVPHSDPQGIGRLCELIQSDVARVLVTS